MANNLYETAREGFLDNSLDWVTGTIRVALVRSAYYDATHRYLSDLTAVGVGGVVHAISTPLLNKTVALGRAGADNITFTGVPLSSAGHVLVVYQSSGPAGGADLATTAQRLIAWLDTGSQIPVVITASSILVAWSNVADTRIFHL